MRLYALDPILFLVLHGDVRQRRLQRIRSLTCKLARRNLVLEHEIQFRVGKTLRLRKTEVSPRDEQKCNTSPEETTLRAPIPVVLANHFRHDCVCDEDNGVV